MRHLLLAALFVLGALTLNEDGWAQESSADFSSGSVIIGWDDRSCSADPSQQIYDVATSTTWQVPADITEITVKAWGAGGGAGGAGANDGGLGGGGGFAQATLTVTPLENLTIRVGGGGDGATTKASACTTGSDPVDAGGNGGGGDATTAAGGGAGGQGCQDPDSVGGGGGGGGYSAVLRSTTYLVQAGGGGGGGGGGEPTGGDGGNGGAGGGATGIAGSAGDGGAGASGGGAGSSGSGGSGGNGAGNGSAGSANTGGDGGDASGDINTAGGGGGGGGRYGGGGGGAEGDGAGGGGGGSSLVTGTNTTETAGSGTAAGNNADADYANNAGQGGTTGSADGSPGRIVISYGGGGAPALEGAIRYHSAATAAPCSGSESFTTPGTDTLTIGADKVGCTATITVKGAGGGYGGFNAGCGGGSGSGGDGGGTQFDFEPDSTGTFEIFVGGGGVGCTTTGAGGTGGGGDGTVTGSNGSGGGGGASAILFDDGTDEILAIAGGGGGAGANWCGGHANGGDGGSLNNGGTGGSNSCSGNTSNPGSGGTGGAASGGNRPGGAGGSSGGNGSNGTGSNSGNGGSGNSTFNVSGGGGNGGQSSPGGGGGAGYGGGGGGGDDTGNGSLNVGGAGGGGFLELTPSSGTTSNSSAVAGGAGSGSGDGADGSVEISWSGTSTGDGGMQYCGVDKNSDYCPNAVTFDGTNDNLSTGSILSDSDKATGSFWFRLNDASSYTSTFFRNQTSRAEIQRPGSGGGQDRITIGFDDSSNTKFSALTPAITDTNWHHVMYSFDAATSSAHIYLDGSDAGAGASSTNTGNAQFSGNLGLGATDSGAERIDADLADFYMDIGTYTDLSIASNRAKFYNNGPVDLGSDGSTPTGSQPEIFFSGDTGTWHTNDGSAGGMSETGALTTASNQPTCGAGSNYAWLGFDGSVQDSNGGSSGGGVPVVEGYQKTDGGGASSSILLTAPSGITSGELLLLIVANEDNTNTAQFSNNLTGWNFLNTTGNDTIDAHIGVFWKQATGSEGNVTVNAQSSDGIIGWYIRISGADTTSPFDVSNFTQGTGNSSSHVIPEVTTTVANTLAVYGLSFDGGDGDPYSVSGTGWTETDEGVSGTSNFADVGGAWGTKDMPTAGGTGAATVSSSVSDGAAYFQLAIKPAP